VYIRYTNEIEDEKIWIDTDYVCRNRTVAPGFGHLQVMDTGYGAAGLLSMTGDRYLEIRFCARLVY
jgi:hypothetical protein